MSVSGYREFAKPGVLPVACMKRHQVPPRPGARCRDNPQVRRAGCPDLRRCFGRRQGGPRSSTFLPLRGRDTVNHSVRVAVNVRVDLPMTSVGFPGGGGLEGHGDHLPRNGHHRLGEVRHCRTFRVALPKPRARGQPDDATVLCGGSIANASGPGCHRSSGNNLTGASSSRGSELHGPRTREQRSGSSGQGSNLDCGRGEECCHQGKTHSP